MTVKLVAGKYDISTLADKITWSGDTKQVARQLTFSLPRMESDKLLPKVSISEGDPVTLQVDGKQLYYGSIMDVESNVSSHTVSYTALDLLWYVNQSDINHVYSDTPERITANICAELGVPLGSAAKTGISVYMPCLGKKAYEAIMAAYTAASRRNGNKYSPLMQRDRLQVIVKGTYCGVVLDGGYNMTEASYKSSMQQVVNRVVITNKDGKTVNTLQDAASRRKYGTVQRVYKQQDDVDNAAEARALLKGLERSGSVTALGDVRAVSGYSVAVQEPVSGLYGKFYVESDTHTWEAGKYTMQLTLAYDNLMDEHEIDKVEDKDKSKSKSKSK